MYSPETVDESVFGVCGLVDSGWIAKGAGLMERVGRSRLQRCKVVIRVHFLRHICKQTNTNIITYAFINPYAAGG